MAYTYGDLKKDTITILKAFDEIMNAKFGDTVTITTDKGSYTRPMTIQDQLEAIKYEWTDTVMRLDEIGIELED